jgi:uncharacterized protein YjbI with pentapeptide repeats
MNQTEDLCEFTANNEDWVNWGGEPEDWKYKPPVNLNQRDVWECPHRAVEGYDRCVFHLSPEEVPEDINEGEELLQAIENHDESTKSDRLNEFVGSEFGRLDINFGLFSQETKSADSDPLVFIGCTFHSRVSFSGTISKPIVVDYSNFRNKLESGNVTFEDKVNFRNIRFAEGADFIDAEFVEDVSFWRSEFNGYSPFVDCDFNGKARFAGIEVNDLIVFDGSTFRGSTQFEGSKFNNVTSFSSENGEVSFKNPPDFSDSELKSVKFIKTDISRANFSGSDIIDCNFSGVDLTAGNLAGADATEANFSNATLQNSDLETVTFSRATLFGTDLRGAKLSGAILGDVQIDDDTKFLGHSSDDSNTSPHTLSTIRSQPTCVYDPDYEEDNEHTDVDKAKSVYRALEELGGKHARPRLQARCFVRRQDLQKQDYWDDATADDASLEERFIAGARWSRAKAARATLLYGESPWRVIAWSLGIIFSFALLYPLGGWMKPADGDPITYAQIASNPVEILNSVYYSTLTYTALGFGDFQPVGFGRLLTTLETGLGAVMLALLVFILGRRAAR